MGNGLPTHCPGMAKSLATPLPPSAIPPHITSTLSRPVLMLVSTDSIILLELTNNQLVVILQL